MPHFTTDDGVKLFYEEVGSGVPIVFVHEFAGDSRSWELQVRYFCRRYRCIAFNARGYPPSDVPDDGEKYSQERACEDIRALADALKIEKPHVVGLSMGGFAALHFGLTYPDRARSLVIAGCGYGAAPTRGHNSPPRPRPSRSALRRQAWQRRPWGMRSVRRASNSKTKTREVGVSLPMSSRSFLRPRRRPDDAGCAETQTVAVRPG